MAIEVPARYKAFVKQKFPLLIENETFEYTSEVDYNYDCLSWAIGAKYLFQNVKGGIWPDKSIPDDTVDGWVKVLEQIGYRVCPTADFVPGFEKIAILEMDGDLHACRSDRIGMWKSKLGDMGPDIDHVNLECLKPSYGPVVLSLQRWRDDWING